MKWLSAIIFLWNFHALGEVVPGERLLFLVDIDGDYLYGSAYFSVENLSDEPEKSRIELVVPEGTVDVEGGHGLKQEEILWGHGKLAVEKEFPPGATVVNYLIKIPQATEELYFQFPYDLSSFGVATTKETPLALASEQMQSGLAEQLAAKYVGISQDHVKAGDKLSVQVNIDEDHAQALEEGPHGGAIHVGDRYLVLVTADAEFVYGQVYFAIYNKTGHAETFKWPIMLPKETIDFKGADGLSAEDLKLDGETLVLEKTFPPGMTLVGVNFKTTHDSGRLTFIPSIEIPRLFIAVPKEIGMELSSLQMEPGLPQMLNVSEYVGIRSTGSVEKDHVIKVDLHGLPEDRMLYWLTGGGTGLLLIFCAVILTFRSLMGRDRDEALIANN